MAGFSRFAAIPASLDRGLFNRLWLRTALSFVVSFFLVLPFSLLAQSVQNLRPSRRSPFVHQRQ